MNKQFIGPKEILGIVKTDKKIIINEIESGEIVEVQYVDGAKESMTQIMFDSIVKEESTDLTTLRENRVYPVVKEILGTFLKWGMKIDEMDYVNASLINSINESTKEADKKVWKKSRNEITMFDLDEILRKKE